MKLLRANAFEPHRARLPMWLLEGTAALFEHLYVAEYWPGLRRRRCSGLVEAVNRTDDLRLGDGFDEGKETYASPSVNYYVETVAVLYLCHSRGLLEATPRLHVLTSGLWKAIAREDDWQAAFAHTFGGSPVDFYAELRSFLTRPDARTAALALVPSAPVLHSCCPEEERAAKGLCARPGCDPLTGDPRPWWVTANLAVRGGCVTVELTTM
jgi:hypothetical protein